MSAKKPPDLPQAKEVYDAGRNQFVRSATCPEHKSHSTVMIGVSKEHWWFRCAVGKHGFKVRPAEQHPMRAVLLRVFGRDAVGRLRE